MSEAVPYNETPIKAHNELASLSLLLIVCIGVFLCAFLPRMGPALNQFQRCPDAIENYAGALEVKRSGEFEVPIRAFFAPDSGSGESLAARQRSPGYLWILSFLVREKSIGFAQLLNAFCAAIACVLAALIAFELAQTEYLGRYRALLAALFAGLCCSFYVPLYWVSIRLLTESIELALLLASFLFLSRGRTSNVILGLLFAAGLVLVRPEGSLTYWLVFIAAFLFRADRGSDSAFGKKWLWCIVAFAVFVLARYQLFLWTGSWSSSQSFLLKVQSLNDLMWDYRGPGTISETRLDMLTACSQIGKNLVGYILAMLSVKAGTLLIPVGFTLALLSGRLLQRSRLGLSLIGVAYLVGKAAVWATFDDRRFIVVPEVLLFILAAVELGHWSICWPGESSEQARNKAALRKIGYALVLGQLTWICLGPGVRVLKRSWRDAQEVTTERSLSPVQAQALKVNSVIAAVRPWPVYMELRRRAVLLPVQMTETSMKRFLEVYEIDAVWLRSSLASNDASSIDGAIREPAHYQDWLIQAGWRKIPGEQGFLLVRPD